MTIRRSATWIIAAGLIPSVLVLPVSAGGSVAHTSRASARPGAEIRLSGTFCEGQLAPVSAGPWFAYLDPRSASPVLMGRVQISPNAGNYCQWRIRAQLTVPRIAPGAYWLQVCDRGCTTGVGDLVGAGEFTVLPASAQASARHLQRLRTRFAELRREESREEHLLQETDIALSDARREIGTLGDRVEELRKAVAAERSEPTAWFGAVLGSVTLACGALVFGVWRRHRRFGDVTVPDTPEELLEQVRA